MPSSFSSATPSFYLRFRLRLLLGFGLLAMLLLALLSWEIYSQYQNDRREAYARTEHFSRAMIAHVGSEIAIVDGALARTAEALARLDKTDLRAPEVIGRILAPSGGAPDTVFWMHFIDERGLGVAASNHASITGVSYADRSYFKAHLGASDTGLFISPPEFGRVSKRRLFFLSRRVVSSTGAFIGVVVAPVDAAALAAVFQDALFQPDLSITLLHSSGKIIARAPRFEESFAQAITTSELFRRITVSHKGSYESPSKIDQTHRIYSYQKIGDFPLTVAVGIASESWTHGIKDELAAASIGIIAFLAVMIFSGRFAFRNFGKLERSEAEQRRLNQDLRSTRDELSEDKKRLRMITNSLPALVSYIDSGERYLFHNSYYRHIPGIDMSRILGRTVREVLGEANYSSIAAQVAATLAGQQVTFEHTMTIDGVALHWKYEYTPDFDADGTVVGFYTMGTDITDLKNIQGRLTQLARVDGLTGLPNRNQLYERLADAIARSRRGAMIGCLYLDIDHFKAINDTLGHAGGDEVLRQFGARLKACVRQTDTVARLAGDEFVIVLEGMDQPGRGALVAAKIIDAMRYPFDIEGQIRLVSTSVGVAIADGSEHDPDALLKKADEALYLAKRGGKNGFATHENVLAASTSRPEGK
jgi:diguanylate cyclase (GGDEF)-like protein/PAS domain S-box-containing protein